MLSPITCPTLSALPGLRHAWFTREGGVSEGPIYGTLNGGLGSQDERARVVENRRRMAAHLAVADDHFLGVWQVHSPDCIVSMVPGAASGRRRTHSPPRRRGSPSPSRRRIAGRCSSPTPKRA